MNDRYEDFQMFCAQISFALVSVSAEEIKDIDSLTTTFVGIRDAWFERYRENRKINIKFFD